jgi:hypothetical protein
MAIKRRSTWALRLARPRARRAAETITGGELLRRSREHGPHFSAEELDRIERLKAEDQPPEDKWRP